MVRNAISPHLTSTGRPHPSLLAPFPGAPQGLLPQTDTLPLRNRRSARRA